MIMNTYLVTVLSLAPPGSVEVSSASLVLRSVSVTAAPTSNPALVTSMTLSSGISEGAIRTG